MRNGRLYQTFDETTGGSAARGSETGRAERKIRNRVKTAAETARAEAGTAAGAIESRAEELKGRAEVWAEEAREKAAAQARAHEDAVRRVETGDFAGRPAYAGKIQEVSRKVGDIIGRVRNVRGRDLVGDSKAFVRDHPNSVFGAMAAGVVVGLFLRRR